MVVDAEVEVEEAAVVVDVAVEEVAVAVEEVAVAVVVEGEVVGEDEVALMHSLRSCDNMCNHIILYIGISFRHYASILYYNNLIISISVKFLKIIKSIYVAFELYLFVIFTYIRVFV